MPDRTTCIHEASHAAAAVWMHRRLEYVETYGGSFLGGEVVGRCRIPRTETIEASQPLIALAGYMAVDEPGWPPPYEEARYERREALGKLIHVLGLDAEQYQDFIELTRRMLADEDFRRLRDAIARALESVPRLDAQAVYELAEHHGVPISEEARTAA